MSPQQLQQFNEMAQKLESLEQWKREREQNLISDPLDRASKQVVYKDVPLFKSKEAAVLSPIVTFQQNTTEGGSATEVFEVDGLLVGDVIFTQIINNGTNNESILQATVTGDNELTVVFSGDPDDDLVFNVIAFRSGSILQNALMTFEVNGFDYQFPYIAND